MKKNVPALHRLAILHVLLLSFSFANAQEIIAFKDADGKYGFKNKTGDIVIAAKYDDARTSYEGLARVKSGANWGFIDKTGKEVTPFKYQDADSLSDGLARVKFNDKWGFIDKTGKEVRPAAYQKVGVFHEGLAWVEQGNKYGYIDRAGKEITSIKYETLSTYSIDSLARVKLNNKWGYINTSGKEVIQPKYDSAYSFEDGLALVNLDGKWGAIDKTEKEVIPVKYYSLEKDYFEWEEGWEETGWFIAKLNANDKSKLIDKNGRELKFTNYNMYGFSEDLLAVSANDKWGYVDFDCKEKIPMKYAVAEDFENGIALVKLNNKWGYIDKNGKEVIQIKYDSVEAFQSKHQNQTWFKFRLNGKWGLLDKSGKEVIPAKYDEVGYSGFVYFSEGLMPIKSNGKWGYVDSTGRLVISAQYDEAFVFSGGKANVKQAGKTIRIDNPLNKISASQNVDGKTEIKTTDTQVKAGVSPPGMKGTIDPSLVGTWKYHDHGSDFNGYYIFRADGTYDYWSDMITSQPPPPNLKNFWRVNGDVIEFLPEDGQEAVRLKVLKRNDPQNNKPALIIQFQPGIDAYRPYYPTESRGLWQESNSNTKTVINAPNIAPVKLSEPPVRMNGSVDFSIIGLWKTTSNNVDYFMDLKADGTEETWSSTNQKKSKAHWRIDNGFFEVIFEGNSKLDRHKFTKVNDLVKGKPTIMLVSSVYYPESDREMWR
jgi:hypothetical protein